MRKKTGPFLLLILMTLSLTGCASIPDLTDEQNEMVTEYAASLLLKYDSENHSRLVDTSKFMNLYEDAKANYDAEEAAYYAQKEEEQKKLEEEKEKAEAQANENTAEESSGEAGGSTDPNGGATVVSNVTMEDYLSLENFTIQYAGFDVMKSYPEDLSEGSFFSCDASQGNNLLIIYFNVANTSDSKQTLDIFNRDIVFRVSVNGGSYKSVFPTMLEDDLSEYLGDFASNEVERLVLTLEVSEDTQVEKLSLNVRESGRDSITLTLR